MVRVNTESTRPELGCFNRRRVKSECLRLLAVMGRGLEASDIRAMTKLGLGVASNDVQVVNQGEEVSSLFICTKCLERISEHGMVKR